MNLLSTQISRSFFVFSKYAQVRGGTANISSRTYWQYTPRTWPHCHCYHCHHRREVHGRWRRRECYRGFFRGLGCWRPGCWRHGGIWLPGCWRQCRCCRRCWGQRGGFHRCWGRQCGVFRLCWGRQRVGFCCCWGRQRGGFRRCWGRQRGGFRCCWGRQHRGFSCGC